MVCCDGPVCAFIFKNPSKPFTVKIGLRVQRAKGLLSLGSTIPQRQVEGGKRGMKEGGKFRDWKETEKKTFLFSHGVRGDRGVECSLILKKKKIHPKTSGKLLCF